jgi:hypothetical protein
MVKLNENVYSPWLSVLCLIKEITEIYIVICVEVVTQGNVQFRPDLWISLGRVTGRDERIATSGTSSSQPINQSVTSCVITVRTTVTALEMESEMHQWLVPIDEFCFNSFLSKPKHIQLFSPLTRAGSEYFQGYFCCPAHWFEAHRQFNSLSRFTCQHTAYSLNCDQGVIRTMME